MNIIAYTYEADVHCPTCALRDAAVGLLKRQPPLDSFADEHGLTPDLVDREGNNIYPVYDIDEHNFTHCGDCQGKIGDHDDSLNVCTEDLYGITDVIVYEYSPAPDTLCRFHLASEVGSPWLEAAKTQTQGWVIQKVRLDFPPWLVEVRR